MKGLLPPDTPREITAPGRVVVTLWGKKTHPIVHTAERAGVRMEKLPKGKAILHVVSLNEVGKIIEVLATYTPTQWKKARVHRPRFKRRPEIMAAYKHQQAVATAMIMNDAFGQNWNPAQVH
jgi:hypothetical protein